MIYDRFNRSFRKLRVSLTHQCNYACIYCSYGEENQVQEMSDLPTQKLLSTTELVGLIEKIHKVSPLNAVRLTGGEPLLHPAISRIINNIRNMGISNIGLTTNGHLLSSKIKSLVVAGLSSVNISLDAVSVEKFTLMSRHEGLTKVLKAIDDCIQEEIPVKINAVIVAGKNDSEILPLLEFAMQKNIIIRFLELMPMGPLFNNRNGLFFSSEQILKQIETKYQTEPSGRETAATANYWNINGKKAFGIIANDSSPFCHDCNRLRIDSYGNIYGCLSSLTPLKTNPEISTNELTGLLHKAISHKQDSHFAGNPRTMQSIGG